MIFKETNYPTPWRRWFAWRPTRIGNTIAWLNIIKRRRLYIWQACRLTGEGASRVLGWEYKCGDMIGMDPRDHIADQQTQYSNEP